jgi:cold-inducible RNA-binding protein
VFVGNLSYDVTREELLETFGAAGKVVDAKVPTDRETGRPRGFAFVEFDDEESVQKSIALLHGKDLKGRALRVNEAEDRPPRAMGAGGAPSYRPSFGGGGGGGGGSYRSGGPPPMLPPADFATEFKKDDRGRSFRGRSTGKPGGGRRNDQKRKKDDVDEDY